MMCATCNRHPASPGRHDCERCRKLLEWVVQRVLDSAREIVRDRIFGPTATPAERASEIVRVKWNVAETAHAIKRSICEAENALVFLPGVFELTDEDLLAVGKKLNALVTRGTEVDSLLVMVPGPEESGSPGF